MKTPKEVQLATHDFLKAFQHNSIDTLDGTFIPINKNILYKKSRYNLALGLITSSISLLLLYQVFWIEYDLPIYIYIITSIAVLVLLALSAIPLIQYRQTQQYVEKLLNDDDTLNYGVLLTDEYYFEYTIDDYHIIPKANIICIDYEEERSNNEIYIELLVDIFDSIQVRSIVYNPAVFDLKAWINTNPNAE